MLALCLQVLLAAAPLPPVTLKAGAAEPGEPVDMIISGLAVPEQRKAGLYLFGKLSVPSQPLRALLLRSSDGGAHWTEVLPTMEHNEVLFVEFEGCQGRALTGWSMEGPGELTLFASSDCGATWKRRSTLPKSVWSDWAEQMDWKDEQQGTVWLVDTAQENPQPHALFTRDGGRTWTPEKQPVPMPSAKPELEAREPSGTQWKVTPEETSVRVEKQEPGGTARVISTLPTRFQRQGAQLVPVPETKSR